MTPKRKSLPRSLLSKCLLFLVFLLLNGFLPVVLIFILRRAVPHRSVPVQNVPRPRPQTLVNPVVSLSGRIEAALLAKDHQSGDLRCTGLIHLIRSARAHGNPAPHAGAFSGKDGGEACAV